LSFVGNKYALKVLFVAGVDGITDYNSMSSIYRHISPSIHPVYTYQFARERVRDGEREIDDTSVQWEVNM